MAKAIDWAAPIRGDFNDEEEVQTTGIDWAAPLREMNEFDAQFAPPAPMPEQETEWSDYGTAAMQCFAGVVEGVGGMTEWVGQRTGIQGLEDVGTTVRETGRSASEAWERGGMELPGIKDIGGYSEAAQQARQKEWATMGDDAAWRDPASWGLGITQSLPYLVTSVLPGGIIAKLGGSARTIATAAGLTNAIQVGGGVHAELMNQIATMPLDQLKQFDGVQEALDQGMPEDQLRAMIGEQVTKYATGGAALVGGVSGWVVGPIEAALAARTMPAGAKGLTAQAATSGRIKGAGLGAVVEGTQESLEAGLAETVIPNIAMGRDPTEGLGEAIVSGAALGGATGAGLGAAAGPQRPEAPPPPATDTTPPDVEYGDQLPDQPTAEPTAYIQGQLPLIGKGGRSAVYASPGTNVGEVDPNVYDVVELENGGTLVVAKGDTNTVDMVREAVATGDDAALQNVLGDVLGYGATGKYAGAQEALRVVDANGNTIYDVAYDARSPEAESMYTAAQEQAAAIGGDVRTVDIDQALYERDQILQEELRGVETPTPEAAPAQPADDTQTPEPTSQPAGQTTTEQATQPVQPVEEPPVETPKSPLSLQSVPDDENKQFRYLTAAYDRAVNTTRDLPHGTKSEALAQAADDLVTTMQGLVQDLKKEGYNISPTAMVRALGPLIARKKSQKGGPISAKDFKEGNFQMPMDLLYKEQGSGGMAAEIAEGTKAAPAEGIAVEGLSPEAIAAQQAAEAEVGPGRKSGRYKGRITERTFNEALARVKKLLDEANIQRQSKRTAPATAAEAEARRTKPEQDAAPRKPGARQQPVVETKPKPGKKAKRAKAPTKPEAKPEPKKAAEPKRDSKPKNDRARKVKEKRDRRSREEKLASVIVDAPVLLPDGTIGTEQSDAAVEISYQQERMGALEQMVRCLSS